MIRMNYLLPVILIWLSTSAAAQSDISSYGTPFSPPTSTWTSNPVDTLNEGMGKLIAHLREKDAGKEAIRQFLHNEIARYFDFRRMAVLVAGPWLQQMAVEQRNQLKEQLMQDFLATLAERLSAYRDQSAQVLTVRPLQGGDAIVTVAINSPSGFPARLDFRMGLSEEGWKIYDVVANGSSAVIYYRTQLQSRIKSLSAAL